MTRRFREQLPELLFALGLAASFVLLAFAGSGLTFFYDEWDVLLNRDGLGAEAFLRSHNGQPFLIPVMVYKLLLAGFGMGSQLPYRLTELVLVSVCVVLLFVYARRRIGSWMALVLTAPALCLGAGWEVLLLPLSMNFTIGLACGLGMLLALERTDLKGDLAACLLLFGSVAAGGLGPAFACGAILDLCLRRRFRQLWVVGAPLLLLGLWSLAYGAEGAELLSRATLTGLPRNVFDSLAAALTSVIGGNAGSVLAVLTLIAVAARFKLARAPVSRETLVIGGTLIAFWVLLALVHSAARLPEASRYQFTGVILALACAAALLEGLPLPRMLPWICLPLVALSIVGSLNSVRDGRTFLAGQTQITRSVLGVLDDERGPDFSPLTLDQDRVGVNYLQFIQPDRYFRAKDRYGTPAYSQAEIAAVPASVRLIAARVRFKIRRERRTATASVIRP